MKIDYVAQDETGKAALTASATGDERPVPVPGLLLDAAPSAVSAEAIAVAGTLLFGRFADSTIAFPRAIDARLAAAIAGATGLVVVSEVKPYPEEDGAIQSDSSIRATRLLVDLGFKIDSATPDVDETRLLLIPGERFQGALWGIKEYVIASNAWYLSSLLDRVSVIASAGVLYATDLLANEIATSNVDNTAAAQIAKDLCLQLGISFN